MRILVFLLVLANLLFFAWAEGYFGAPVNPDAFRMQQQIKPEQLTIIGRDEPPSIPAETSAPAPVQVPAPVPVQAEPVVPPEPVPVEKPPEQKIVKEANSCLLWSDLVLGDADRLERLIAGKFSTLKLKRRSTPGSGTYWVFIPPFASKQEADARAAELRELGAPEFFILQDAGPNRLAISLGVFSTPEAANERLETLRAKGIKGARTGERNVKPALVSLEARGPQGQADALREAAVALLPKSKPAVCKAR